MDKTKVAVLVSGGGTNLQALINAEKSGVIKSGEIVIVISDRPGAYAIERARMAGIRAEEVFRDSFGSRKAFEARVIELLEECGVELIVLAGFLCILSKEFTRRYENRIINVHPSLIPSFCGDGFYGLTVHEKALEYGVKVSGATVHFVNEITDGGKIIMQKAVDVLDGDTPETLQQRIMEQAEWVILPQATELLCRQIMEEKQGSGQPA